MPLAANDLTGERGCRMPNERNIQQVKNIREDFQNSEVIILTEYQGLTVEEMNELRVQCREAEVRYKVCKNKLINVVAQELEIEGLDPYLRGTTAVALSNDPASSARILRDFSRQHENLKVKSGILGKRVIDAAAVENLINMPSREQLIAHAVGNIKAPIAGLVSVLGNRSPAGGLVNILNGSLRQTVTLFEAIAEKRKEAEQA